VLAKSAMSNPWLVWPRPNPNARLRLFCFSYAGGSAAIYRHWPSKLQTDLEVVAIELPGRGNRIREEPLNRLPAVVELTARAIVPHLNKPYTFFGHSLGALLSFEVARHLRRNYRHVPAPAHLFVSGRGAPQVVNGRYMIHNLPEAQLLTEVRRLNGTPPEVLADPELMELVLPLLRADFALCDTYVYEDDEPLVSPISAYGGLQDAEVSRAQLTEWGRQTFAAFRVSMFPGDHFFIHADVRLLLQTLARELQEVIGR
jgi:medium-chain acyl-[acyl-carrier-protein] hydrolase